MSGLGGQCEHNLAVPSVLPGSQRSSHPSACHTSAPGVMGSTMRGFVRENHVLQFTSATALLAPQGEQAVGRGGSARAGPHQTF